MSGQEKKQYRVEGVMGTEVTRTAKEMELKMNKLHLDGYDVGEPLMFGGHFILVGRAMKVKVRGKK